MGRYGIPDDILENIRKRDWRCVYCLKVMIFPPDPIRRGDSATIEHLAEDGPGYWDEGLNADGLAYCCGSCNSSRGPKPLLKWFATEYCIERKINSMTVAKPVRDFLKTNSSK